MPSVIFDFKKILVPTSCIERFGIDLTLYNIRIGSNSTFKSFYTGAATSIAKEFGPKYAYRLAGYAFRGTPKKLVEECSEKYRKLAPEVSKRAIRNIKDSGIDVGIITHDVHSLCLGVFDELDVDPDDVRDNDFTFHKGRVSGIDHDQYGWPRVHDKTHALREYMFYRGYSIEDVVLVVHGPEEVPMARMVKNRIIVPEKGSCRELREHAMKVYENLESLPEMIAGIFKK